MASESLKFPIWSNDRLVTFYPGYVNENYRPKISEFVVRYIRNKIGRGLQISATWPTPSEHLIGTLPKLRVQFRLLHDWTPWSSMPLDWTEGVDSIINEALTSAQDVNILSKSLKWSIKAVPCVPCISAEEPGHSLKAPDVTFESLPIDVANESTDHIADLTYDKDVLFTIPIRASYGYGRVDVQGRLCGFVVGYIEGKNRVHVKARFVSDKHMEVKLFFVKSSWTSFSYIDEALRSANRALFLPKDEEWIISDAGTWTISLPQDGPVRRLQAPTASEGLSSEDVAAQSHQLPILSTDREVSFWIPIQPDRQSDLVAFVVKHMREKYGLSVLAEFMFSNIGTSFPQNQMILRTSLPWDWKAPSAMPSDREKCIDNIIDKTLRAALGERLLPRNEVWTISDLGAWGFGPVEPAESPLPPVASEASDQSIWFPTDVGIILDVIFFPSIVFPHQPPVAFLETYIRDRLHVSVEVKLEYPQLIGIKMKVSIEGRLDSILQAGNVLDEGLHEAVKDRILPVGESWTIAVRCAPFPVSDNGEGRH